MKPIFHKFLLNGLLNTGFGYLVYSITFLITKDYQISLALSTIIGTMFNYFSYAKFTFKKNHKLGSFFRFILSYFFIYLINLGILKFLTDKEYSALISQIIALPFCILISFLFMKLWVYK